MTSHLGAAVHLPLREQERAEVTDLTFRPRGMVGQRLDEGW